MGSESSALKSYTLKEPPFTLPSGLAVHPAVLQDGRCASVFVYKRENEDKVNKAAKHLKTLRHPCLLRFLSCTVEADGIHLVTERVQPLEVALETLSSAEVCAGIYDILLALIFLHDRGHLTHNNVCSSSVFVSEDGHWKLGGMETVCRVPQATPEFLRSIQSVRDPASVPPEEMSPGFTTLPESHGHARDAYAFGTLVESLLTILSGQVSADVLSSLQQTLHSALLNPLPKRRPALRTLLSHDFFRSSGKIPVTGTRDASLPSLSEFFLPQSRLEIRPPLVVLGHPIPLLSGQFMSPHPVAAEAQMTLAAQTTRNDFLEVVNFLKSLTLKSEEEKTEFFKFLLDRVSGLSEELIASRLVPLLLNQLVFAEPVAVKSFLPHLLGPKKDSARGEPPCLLSPALFQSRVIPVLLQLFQVHEEHVRMVLLSHLEAYVGHFTQEQLKKVILPQVLLGLRDTSDSIVAITLHSLAVLVSLLGPEVVVGGERTKIFKRTAPSFTKTVDLSPEDSPPHVVRNQQSQMAPILENPSSGIFPKCFFPGSIPISKKHTQRDCYSSLLQTGDQFPQPSKFRMNGLSDMNNTSGDRENFPSSSKKSEEWPDWSEPEEPENKAVSIRDCPTESYDASASPLANVRAEAASDDPEPGSLDAEPGAGGGGPAVPPGTSREQEALPALLSLAEEPEPSKSSLPQETSLAQRGDDPDQTKPPEVSSQERRLTASSELGLGEEFTIQVKRKPVPDPELDWFADMIPEIKPSAALLILPELRTEMMVSDKDDVSPVMQFSSKFAAAEMTEEVPLPSAGASGPFTCRNDWSQQLPLVCFISLQGESGGWGDEGELNWEDDNW